MCAESAGWNGGPGEVCGEDRPVRSLSCMNANVTGVLAPRCHMAILAERWQSSFRMRW